MIKLIKSTFYKEEETKRKLAEFILKTDILSMSAECKKFEENFAKKQGRKFAVFVNSGSSANLVLIQALLNLGKLKKGDKVGVSALTWATNIMPLIQLGLEPVAIDCEISTLNISPAILKDYTDDLKGLFLTNVLGFCDNIKEIKNICSENNILFIEDNCESLGSKVNNELLGNFGLASTFSFFVGHHLSTVEGGMICTDDEELYHKMLKVRAHGWDRNLPQSRKEQLKNEHQVEDFYTRYTFYDLAYNVRPTEIQGFLGNIQLQYWDEIVKERERLFNIFQEVISKNDDLFTLNMEHMDLVSNFAMPVIIKDAQALKKYMKKFIEKEIEIRPVIAGNITEQPFFKKYISNQINHSNANYIHYNGFYFGNNPEMADEEIELLCELLR